MNHDIKDIREKLIEKREVTGNQEKVTDAIETVKLSIDRLKMLYNTSEIVYSKGELGAFADSVRSVLGYDIEMLEDAVDGLNWTLEKKVANPTPKSQPIETIEQKVISYSLWDEFYHEMTSFIGRLEFVVKSGFETDETYMALTVVEDYMEKARKTADEYSKKAKDETGVNHETDK